jgi:hypothetical protein
LKFYKKQTAEVHDWLELSRPIDPSRNQDFPLQGDRNIAADSQK